MMKEKNILLVEEDLIIGLHQKKELEKKSYKVKHVNTSEKAIEAAFKEGACFDLILMDIDLGSGPDGIQTAQQIIEKKDIPILFLSSHTESEVVEKTEKVTSYGYVVKNTGMTVLDASIKMAFRLHDAKKNELIARQKVERALKISENSMDQLIDHMMEGFLLVEPILDENNRVKDILYLKINPAVEKITGLSEADYIGKSARQLFKNNVEESYFDKYNQVFKTGMPIQFTESFSLLNQCYELSVYKVGARKLAIFFHDITERITSEAALKESENKYRSLFDFMDHEVHFWKLVRNQDGEIKTWSLVDVNPAALKAWGKKREEILGKTTDEVFSNVKASELFMPIVNKIFKEGKPHSWEMFFEATNQHLFMTSVPFGEYFVTTGIDITDNKLLKERLKEKEILVKEILHRAKNNFSSIIALLKLQSESITNQEALDVINESTGRIESMSKIYEKLLLSDGFSNLKIKSYLEDLASSILDLISDKDSIKLELEIDDFILEEKKIFPLGAIINELITNSLKHAFNGREEGKISLALIKNNNIITLNYHDNGNGLPKDFDKKNTGLGLMLVNLFSEQLNGKYQISSDAGLRCVITFAI